MSYPIENVPLLTAPINLDAVIQRIQKELKKRLEWLEYSFGRATVGRRVDVATGKELIYPQVYDGAGGYISAEPSDLYAAQSFVQLGGPEVSSDYEKMQYNIYEAPLEIVFLFDLDLITQNLPKYELDYRYTEVLKAEIKRALGMCSDVNAIIAIHEAPEQVLKGYTYNHLERQTFKHPKGGFKFVVAVSYLEQC
jgi:hypothetical protein